MSETEKCSYCGAECPKPVSYHHSQHDCDLEMTKLCAEAMGSQVVEDDGFLWGANDMWREQYYSPLTDDAQAMALVKKLRVTIGHDGLGKWIVEWWPAHQSLYPRHETEGADLNRAIVECVAKMQAAKAKDA